MKDLNVKPILTVGIPGLTSEMHTSIKAKLQEDIEGYNILLYGTNPSSGGVQFESFYPSDFNDIGLMELEDKVFKILKD